VNPIRIAMWSGPRNISTALMRAFENRSDCVVWDEPLSLGARDQLIADRARPYYEHLFQYSE